jgi:hypothetical protein
MTMKPFTRAILAIAVLAIISAAFFGIRKQLSQEPIPSRVSPEIVTAGSVITLFSSYENPGKSSLRIQIEEHLPEGTLYIPGSLASDSHFLTDAKDNDQGYFDEGRNMVVWEVGSIAPRASGNVSYQVRVTGAREVMESATKIILDPGTEDEEVLTSEPFVFYLGKPLPTSRTITPLSR